MKRETVIISACFRHGSRPERVRFQLPSRPRPPPTKAAEETTAEEKTEAEN